MVKLVSHWLGAGVHFWTWYNIPTVIGVLFVYQESRRDKTKYSGGIVDQGQAVMYWGALGKCLTHFCKAACTHWLLTGDQSHHSIWSQPRHCVCANTSFLFLVYQGLKGRERQRHRHRDRDRDRDRATTDQIRHGRLMLAGSRNLFTGNKRKKPKPHVQFTYEIQSCGQVV